MYATVDALKGMIAYQMMLDNKGLPFDVTNEVTRILSPEQPEETTGHEETTTANHLDETTDTAVTEENTDTSAAIPDTKTPETSTASNSSAKTGENDSMTAILLMLCVLSTGTVIFARKTALQQHGK